MMAADQERYYSNFVVTKYATIHVKKHTTCNY